MSIIFQTTLTLAEYFLSTTMSSECLWPAVTHDDHPQLVSKVLHLMNLNKGPSVVDGIKRLGCIWVITGGKKKKWYLLIIDDHEQSELF